MKSIAEQWEAVQAAAAALVGVPDAKITVGYGLEEPVVQALASWLGVTVKRHVALYDHAWMATGRKPLTIYSFDGRLSGIEVSGQGSRVSTEAEIRTCTLHHATSDPDATVEEALERLADKPKKAKRDEFSCPCCGTPTDSSYCDDCTEAECGEQDVGTPHKCLVGICQTCGGKKNERHTLNVCADGHESPPRDDHDLRADMRREDLGGWHP